MTNQTPPTQPLTIATDLLAPRFDNVAIALFDLFRETIRAGKPVIQDRVFTNCQLEGPAVAGIFGGCEFDNVDFGYSAGDIRNMIIRSGTPGKMIGAIPFQNCKFVNCRFFAVGFTGPEPFLEQLLALQTR